VPPKVANSQALQAAMKALELDDTLAEAHAMVGSLRACDFDWENAKRELRRAIELNPRSADVWTHYNYYYLVPMGRLDEAITAARRSVEIDPLSSFARYRLGSWYFYSGERDRALVEYRHALELDPYNFNVHFDLGFVYLQMEKIDDAVREFETAARMTERMSFTAGMLGVVYALAGRVGDARAVLAELQDLAQKTFPRPAILGWIYHALGEDDNAFDCLELAVDSSDPVMLHLAVHPGYDAWRSHPRYRTLLRKMNLAP